jgi:hypothetical protein
VGIPHQPEIISPYLSGRQEEFKTWFIFCKLVSTYSLKLVKLPSLPGVKKLVLIPASPELRIGFG